MTKKEAIAILIREVEGFAHDLLEENDPEYTEVKEAIAVLTKKSNNA